MKKLRVGLVGAGNIANVHLDAYKNVAEVEIAAICDINAERLDITADKYSIEKRFTSIDEMLASVELDAADVCVWNCSHAECSIKALNAGLHVLCEKPMAMSVEEAEAMEKAAKDNNKLLMLGFVTRFSKESVVAQDFIKNGYLGDIYYTKATYVRRHGNPGGWFSDKSRSGGGPIIDIGVHPLDLTRFLMGNPKPVSVYAVMADSAMNQSRAQLKTRVDWYPKGADPKTDVCDIESSGTAIIRYENGACTVLETAYSINGEAQNGRVLYGTKGGLTLDNGMKLYTDINGFLADVELKDLDNYEGVEPMFTAEVRHFADCCLNGTECKSPAHDGVVVMKILDALYKSAETGHEVILED